MYNCQMGRVIKMFISFSLIILFWAILIISIGGTIYFYLEYREDEKILSQYKQITDSFNELQEGIGKYRESSTPPHYFVSAVGNRNAAHTYRK